MNPRLQLQAPAKVNLFLHVVGRRPDGYHELDMLMVKLTLADELQFEPSGDGLIHFELYGKSDARMASNDNLVVRAAKALQELSGTKRGARITLTKKIPVAAGLGGGSSDAATTLIGLNRLWGLHLSSQQLADMGLSLGADIPFFCFEGPAFVEGIGERITPIKDFPKLFLLLINPGFPLSTREVFAEISLTGGGTFVTSRRPLLSTFRDVTPLLHNDLEKVSIAKHPVIGEMKKSFLRFGAAGALMSGSGPTVFGLFEDAMTRDAAAQKLAAAHAGWFMVAAESQAEHWGVDQR